MAERSLVTDDTTVRELGEMLRGRRTVGRAFTLYPAIDGEWEVTRDGNLDRPTQGLTLAEALSALLGEIPAAVPAPAPCPSCRAPQCECGDSAGWEAP